MAKYKKRALKKPNPLSGWSGEDRRSGRERRRADRRKVDIPVEVDRRSGNDRRCSEDRRKCPLG